VAWPHPFFIHSQTADRRSVAADSWMPHASTGHQKEPFGIISAGFYRQYAVPVAKPMELKH